MNSVPAWLLIITGLGGGAIGAIITTYGTQTRERRQARAAAREALRKAENLPLHPDRPEQIETALDAFETSAMLAGLPRAFTALHREARWRSATLPDAPTEGDPATVTRGQTEQRTYRRVASQAAELLTHATWHPWATAPWRWHRTRQLTRLLTVGTASQTRLTESLERETRKWERDTIRAGKTRKNGKRMGS